MRGVRYLFHVAADYRFWARDPSVILRANVDGTRNLMQEALAAGVERIVHTSSVATLKLAGATGPVDETAPFSGRSHRRVQAQQDAGRAGGRGHDRARQAAGRDRQSDDADRPARHQADADRPHPARRRARQDSRLRRYRPELRACRRHRRGPSARLRARPDRRTLHPRRRERAAAQSARDRRRRRRPARADHPAAAAADLSPGLRSAGVRATSPARSPC